MDLQSILYDAIVRQGLMLRTAYFPQPPSASKVVTPVI